MFITNDGAFAANVITSEQSYLLLSCAGMADILVLSEFVTDTPYELFKEGFDKSAGRSLTGAIRVQGNDYAATRAWALSFVVGAAQLALFEAMLEVQASEQVSIEDRWGVSALTAPVWLDVDARYAAKRAGDYLLQFSAREEI
jgi:hypothetical protein